MCVIKRPILTEFVHQQAQAGQTGKAKKRKRKVEAAASDTKHDTAAAVRDLFCNLQFAVARETHHCRCVQAAAGSPAAETSDDVPMTGDPAAAAAPAPAADAAPEVSRYCAAHVNTRQLMSMVCRPFVVTSKQNDLHATARSALHASGHWHADDTKGCQQPVQLLPPQGQSVREPRTHLQKTTSSSLSSHGC